MLCDEGAMIRITRLLLAGLFVPVVASCGTAAAPSQAPTAVVTPTLAATPVATPTEPAATLLAADAEVLYEWWSPSGVKELRLVHADGSEPRVIGADIAPGLRHGA